MLHSPDDFRLTPDQRRREIASILARGILRLAREARTTREDPEAEEHAPDPAQKALEVSPTPRPHVTRG